MPAETSARLLRLLSLLQRRPSWSGPDLAERLGVTTRTVRRDIERLRSLGYPVPAAPGVIGGYRLEAGATMPPLLLDDDEATAVAVALGSATAGLTASQPGSGSDDRADGARVGLAEASLSALSKLDRVLPAGIRTAADAVRRSTVDLSAPAGSESVDPAVLVLAAHACADSERLRLTYRDRNGQSTQRRVDPHRMVFTGRRWYLVARDVDRAGDDDGGWRTLRVDRMGPVERTGHRVRIDDPPDAARFVSAGVSVAPYRHVARVRFATTAAALRLRIPPTVGVVTEDDQGGAVGSLLEIGADDLAGLAGRLISLGIDFEVLDPPELRAHLRSLGQQLSAKHATR